MSADKKVAQATTPKTKAASAKKPPAPKNAATAKRAETVKVEAKAPTQHKATPKAASLPTVLARAPKLFSMDDVIFRIGACLGHELWGQVNGPVLVEFKKFNETGEVTTGTIWAVNTAEKVLQGMTKSAAKAADLAEAEAYIMKNGAEIVLRAIDCTKSPFWEGLRKEGGRYNPPRRRMFLVEEAAAGLLTPDNISGVYDALVTLEKVLSNMQTVVVHGGQRSRLTQVDGFAGVKSNGRVRVTPVR